MMCDNCASTDEIAFTLTTHVERGEPVHLHFCSSECLDVWT